MVVHRVDHFLHYLQLQSTKTPQQRIKSIRTTRNNCLYLFLQPLDRFVHCGLSCDKCHIVAHLFASVLKDHHFHLPPPPPPHRPRLSRPERSEHRVRKHPFHLELGFFFALRRLLNARFASRRVWTSAFIRVTRCAIACAALESWSTAL